MVFFIGSADTFYKFEREQISNILRILVSFLVPFTAFAHLGVAIVTLISSSKRLLTGIQYLLVDSI